MPESLDELLSRGRAELEVELGPSGEGHFLMLAIERYRAIRSPFDGLLEAPEVVNAAYSRHAAGIRISVEELRDAMRPVLKEVYAAMQTKS